MRRQRRVDSEDVASVGKDNDLCSLLVRQGDG